MRRRLWIIFAVTVLSAVAFVLWPRGVDAVVRNAGGETMRGVRVVVTGRSYTLGDIRPNEVRSVRVNPAGESAITIEFTDGSGAPKAVHVDEYIEHDYSGTIRIDVADGDVINEASSARVTPL